MSTAVSNATTGPPLSRAARTSSLIRRVVLFRTPLLFLCPPLRLDAEQRVILIAEVDLVEARGLLVPALYAGVAHLWFQ